MKRTLSKLGAIAQISLASLIMLVTFSCQSDDNGMDPVKDTENPSIYVLSPTSEEMYVTTDNTITISGAADDNDILGSISYVTNTGAKGVASGLEDWTISNMPLSEGDNNVVITATDKSGNTGVANITITKNQYLTFLGTPTIDHDVIYANDPTTIWITANIAPNEHLITSSVRLIEVDDNNNEIGEICSLYDDGNLEHGDEIKGDNVFSVKHVFKYSGEQTKKFRVSARTKEDAGEVEGFSAIFVLTVVDRSIAEQKVLEMMRTQQDIEKKLTDLSSLPVNEKATQLMEWMKGNPKIAEVKEENGLVTIKHQSGLISYVSITDGSNYKGGSGNDGDRYKTPSIPLVQQTRGVLHAPMRRVMNAGQQTKDNTIVLNRKVLVWAPFESGNDPGVFSRAMYTSLNGIFENSPVDFVVRHVQDQACTRISLEDISQYGIIVFDTHGSGGNLIYTREKTSFEQDVEEDRNIVLQFWSGLCCLVTTAGGNSNALGTYYAVTSKYIRNKVVGRFPNTIVFNGSCESLKTRQLSDAFISKGAKTYLGFREKVGVDICIEKANEFFTAFTGNELKKTGEAYRYDKFMDGDHENEYLMTGSKEMHFYLGLINGDFEYGNLNGWDVSGDGRVITQLGSQRPTQETFMGIVSTGLGYTTDYGCISQTFLVTNETQLSIKWNFLSEEFLEYVGSSYQDYLKVTIVDGDNEEVLINKSIDQFASDYTLSMVSPGIVFDKGDVYTTGWITSTFDISKYKGKKVKLVIETGDIGDSIYDSATLLDEIRVF